jgi:hypothetical protein
MLLISLILVSLLGLSCATIFFRAWKAEAAEIFSPRTIFCALIAYYTVLGPLMTFALGKTEFLGVDVGPVMWKGWLASIVALFCFLVGYVQGSESYKLSQVRTRDDAVVRMAVVLFLVGGSAMIFWVVNYGGGLSFFNLSYNPDVENSLSEGVVGTLGVYVLQFININFAAIVILMLFLLDRRSALLLGLFIATLTISIVFFLKSGFRYRIAWLAIALVSSYYLWRRKRPSIALWTPVALVFVMLMGLIGATRNYWGGYSMARASEMSFADYFEGGMAEGSATFLTLSQVIDTVPSQYSHTWLDPLWVAITYPIPRSFWAGKPTSQTLDTLISAFGTNEALTAGQAVPFFGEWYIALGWPGIVISSWIFGRVARFLWSWYRRRERDKFALVIYGVGLGLIFVTFSRGLFAQAVLNGCFALVPLVVLYAYFPKETQVSNGCRGITTKVPGRGRFL